MNNAILLKQKRLAQTILIHLSPEILTLNIPVMVSDGFGGTMPDPAGSTTTLKLKYRVFHERRNPEGLSESPGGLSTNLSRAIMSDYKNDLLSAENAVITYQGNQYRIGKVDTLKLYGGIFGYQAPLIES